jgi:hypothetical protein
MRTWQDIGIATPSNSGPSTSLDRPDLRAILQKIADIAEPIF